MQPISFSIDAKHVVAKTSIIENRCDKGFPPDKRHACVREASDAPNVIETHEHKGDFKEP